MAKKANHFWIEPDDLARKGIDYCSLAAQGLWLKVMRLLHASERYGHLTRDGKPVTDEQAARRCGIVVSEWIALRDELFEFDLLKRSADGIIYSPGLIRQEDDRRKEKENKRPHIPLPIRGLVLSVGSCAYCGATEKLTIDHIVPFSKGGAHRLSNFQPLCAACNRAKSDKTEEEYFVRLNNE